VVCPPKHHARLGRNVAFLFVVSSSIGRLNPRVDDPPARLSKSQRSKRGSWLAAKGEGSPVTDQCLFKELNQFWSSDVPAASALDCQDSLLMIRRRRVVAVSAQPPVFFDDNTPSNVASIRLYNEAWTFFENTIDSPSAAVDNYTLHAMQANTGWFVFLKASIDFHIALFMQQYGIFTSGFVSFRLSIVPLAAKCLQCGDSNSSIGF